MNIKIININLLDDINIENSKFADIPNIEILMQHKLQNLKIIFYELLKINAPIEIFIETDLDYVKANLSKIILYYFKKVWNNETIKLEDKFFRCIICNAWAYIQTNEKSVCVICYNKKNGVRVGKLW